MVMERFGEDIEKKFTAAGRKFSLGTVCYLALQLVGIILTRALLILLWARLAGAINMKVGFELCVCGGGGYE